MGPVRLGQITEPSAHASSSTPSPNAFFQVLDDALARHVGEEAAAFIRVVFSLNHRATIEGLFSDAGFRDTVVRTYTKPLRLPAAREFLWQYVHSTPLSGMLSTLDAACITALEQEIVQGWQPWSDEDGMRYEQPMNVAQARK